MRLKSVQVGKLDRVHSAAKSAAECLVSLTPLLKNEAYLNVELVQNLMLLKPIVVVKSETSFEVVAGFREWHLAHQHFDETDKISVREVVKINSTEIKQMAWADVYGLALTHSLNPKKVALQLSAISEQIPEKLRVEMFAGVANKQQLSKATESPEAHFMIHIHPKKKMNLPMILSSGDRVEWNNPRFYRS